MITIARLAMDYATYQLRHGRFSRFEQSQRPEYPNFYYLGYGKLAEMIAGTRAVPDLGILEIKYKDAFAGRVLRVYQQVDRIMSDVWETGTYAEVWNDETQAVESFYVGGYSNGGSYYSKAEADAGEEIQAKAAAWKAAKEAKAAAERAEREAELEARTFRSGKRVKVARGRKIPIGTEGVIFWMGVDNWGKQKLGIATSDRKVGGKFADVQWVAASNCDIVRAQEAAAVA